MIQITLTTAILLYGSVIVVGFVLLYLISELHASRMYRVLEKQFLWRCAFCGYLYLDEDALTVSQCPRCESFNTVSDAQDADVRLAKQRSETVLPDAQEKESKLEDDASPRRNSARRKRHGQSHRGPRRRH